MLYTLSKNGKAYPILDTTLDTAEARTEYSKKVLEDTPSDLISNAFLELLANYIIYVDGTIKNNEQGIISENRKKTIYEHETSFEGIVEKMEEKSESGKAGADSIYNHVTSDKNIIFKPKVSITEEDIETVPGLKQLVQNIKAIEKQLETATGRTRAALIKQKIEMSQNQYLLKNIYKKQINSNAASKNITSNFTKINLEEHVYIDAIGNIVSTGLVNFYDPLHVSAILCNYSRIKEDSYDNFISDAKWMIQDFEDLVDRTLKDAYPMYYALVIYKIDGLQNIEIQTRLEEEFGIKHSVEYISALWRKKIPKLIVEQAEREWLEWHYTMEERGQWKKCSRCGQIKLAHNMFFSKNSTSKDGWYSICKCCRNKKK